MAESLGEGPTVRDSQALHFHLCSRDGCHHSWSCVSRVCMVLRDVAITNLLTGEVGPQTLVPDFCRRHKP